MDSIREEDHNDSMHDENQEFVNELNKSHVSNSNLSHHEIEQLIENEEGHENEEND